MIKYLWTELGGAGRENIWLSGSWRKDLATLGPYTMCSSQSKYIILSQVGPTGTGLAVWCQYICPRENTSGHNLETRKRVWRFLTFSSSAASIELYPHSYVTLPLLGKDSYEPSVYRWGQQVTDNTSPIRVSCKYLKQKRIISVSDDSVTSVP